MCVSVCVFPSISRIQHIYFVSFGHSHSHTSVHTSRYTTFCLMACSRRCRHEPHSVSLFFVLRKMFVCFFVVILFFYSFISICCSYCVCVQNSDTQHQVYTLVEYMLFFFSIHRSRAVSYKFKMQTNVVCARCVSSEMKWQ